AFAPRGYWSSPTTPLATDVRAAVGLERVTRDPFFVGLALVMAAHALLATRLVGAVFCAGFVVLIVAGSVHQTRKLRARHGATYDGYLATTSFVPFAAVLRGEQRIVWRELPWLSLAAGAAAAFAV